MAKIELKNVTKSYGAVQVIKGIDLTIEKGEFMVFVGPSGCGKSTLLRLISGLEEITTGDMLFDGERVNNVIPSKRGIAMVFQSYAFSIAPEGLRQHGLRDEAGQNFGHRDQEAGGERRETSPDRPPARPPAKTAFGRPTPACRHRPRHRPRPARVPLRRTAVEPGRRPSSTDPSGNRGLASVQRR